MFVMDSCLRESCVSFGLYVPKQYIVAYGDNRSCHVILCISEKYCLHRKRMTILFGNNKIILQ